MSSCFSLSRYGEEHCYPSNRCVKDHRHRTNYHKKHCSRTTLGAASSRYKLSQHPPFLFNQTLGCEACLLRAAQEEHFVGSSSSGFLSHRAQQWCPQEQNRSSVPPPPPPLIQLLLQCLRCSFTVPAGSYWACSVSLALMYEGLAPKAIVLLAQRNPSFTNEWISRVRRRTPPPSARIKYYHKLAS